jgi:TolB protein
MFFLKEVEGGFMKINMFLEASLMNWRPRLVFPCAVLAAALIVGTTGIATAEQCLVPTIVFSSTRDHTDLGLARAEIYLMMINEDGTFNVDDAVRLTEDEVGVNGLFGGNVLAKLSPDGKKIVFDSNRNRALNEPLNTSDLFVMNTDGTEQTPLIRGSSASWSPNGKYIAFHRSASGIGLPIRGDPGAATFDSDIFIANVDDLLKNVEDPINITNSSDYIDDDPDWSPDGKKIVFTRHSVNDNHSNSTTAEICVLDLQTPDAQPQCLLGQPTNFEEERAPAWSPDGTRIAYMCRRGGSDFELCVINADGSDHVQLTNNTSLDATPTWSSDGSKIYFHSNRTGTNQIFVMNADGTDQTQLTDNTLGINLFPAWGVVRANCAEGD